MNDKNATKHDWTIEDRAEYRRAIVRESQRKRRALAKAVGLCTICGSRVHAFGRVTCEQCGNYAKEYQRRRRQ